MKTIKINGEIFQLVEKRDKEALAERVQHHKDFYTHKTIWNAYGRPSQTKVEIWEYWDNWAYDTAEVTYLEVSGAGSHFFSIEAVVELDGVEGIMTITAYNNKIEI